MELAHSKYCLAADDDALVHFMLKVSIKEYINILRFVLAELTIELFQFIGAVLVATVGVALYIARLHWKINMIEKRIDNNPLLSAFDTHLKGKGVESFFDTILKHGSVESNT